MINKFIDKISVHAPKKIGGERVQEVEIHLNFIGKFELPQPELTEKEIKRQEQLKRHRLKNRERYRLIKAGKRKVGEPFTLQCKCCDKPFEAKHSNALFCSPSCRAAYYRQQAAEKRKRECVCENCGISFITTRNDVKFCCENCRLEAKHIKQRERNKKKQTEKKTA